jgi:hypothetical protein
MVTVSLLSGFSVWVAAGHIRLAFGPGQEVALSPERLADLVAGKVVGTHFGTLCLTGSRLVITYQGNCEILLFPPALIGEFVAQLDAIEAVPLHAPGGG